MSFISFVFILESDISPEQRLERFARAKGKTFFLIPSCSKPKLEQLKRLVLNSATIELSKKTPAELINSIRTRIVNQMLKEQTPSCKLTKCLEHSLYEIDIDERVNVPCCEGKKLAESIK